MKTMKPIVFIQGDKKFYRDNRFAQNIILKALSEGVTDVQELRKIAGLRATADVYRTLDKLAIRKEYHSALGKLGIDLEFIAKGIKDVAENSEKDSTRLKAYQLLLRSLGLEKYETDEDKGKNWEETIISAFQLPQAEEQSTESAAYIDAIEEDYEVIVPAVPEEVRQRRDEEHQLARELYG